MITRKELNTYGPAGFHLAQKEKDYLQHWVLSFLSRTGFPAAFKGGTALQKVFSLPRYSEDLDFTFLNKEALFNEKSLQAFLSSGGFSGLVFSRQEREDALSIKLRFKGPLYNGTERSQGTLRIDLSKREHVALEPITKLITPPYPDLLPYAVKVMALDEILAEKIRALFVRKSARDLFDLYFVLKRGAKYNSKLIAEKLSYYNVIFSGKALAQHIKKIKPVWDKEITALTPNIFSFSEAEQEVLKKLKGLR